MSHFTEQAIQSAFMKLLSERPLDKITVREIAAECGISRNTFYYHYHDVYDLLETMLVAEEKRMLADMGTVSSLREGFTQATKYAIENRTALYHIYISVNRDVLTRYLYNAASISIKRFLANQCGNRKVNEQDFNDLVFLYASMIEGAIINIMREGLTRDVQALVDNAIRLLDGTLALALDNCRKSDSL